MYGLTESLCRTNECSFTTVGSGITINCAPYTSTLYNGCFIVEETTSGKVTTSTICETDSTALPTYLSNCTMGTYFPSHTNDEDFTGYTVCPYNVVLQEGCKTTDWPYFYSEIAVTCNPPCTSTFTSGSSTYTTVVDPCPTYEDPLITVFPTTTDYDGSCALYNGNMTCPDHCVLTSSDEYYGDTMYVKASYSCDPRLSCLFVGYWGPTPSFSCITYSTESISGLEDCFTSLIYPSYTSDYSTIFTLCPWHVSIQLVVILQVGHIVLLKLLKLVIHHVHQLIQVVLILSLPLSIHVLQLQILVNHRLKVFVILRIVCHIIHQ